jgi:hypothetical protein
MSPMRWNVYFHPKFKAEFDELAEAVQDELLAMLTPLRQFGPALGRPEVDTLKGSQYANMKELRFKATGGVWRVAFAFDPARDAILLVAGTSPVEVKRRSIDGSSKRQIVVIESISKIASRWRRVRCEDWLPRRR